MDINSLICGVVGHKWNTYYVECERCQQHVNVNVLRSHKARYQP